MIAIPKLTSANTQLINFKRCTLANTQAEQALDDITQMASVLCGTPIALMSLLDRDRQWFETRPGQSSKAQAFCEYMVLADEVMVIEDLTQDDRLKNNPLLRQIADIRFFAGAPLINEQGRTIGSLCVLDTQPRTLSEEQLRALAGLARRVVAEIELRVAHQSIQAKFSRVKTIDGLVSMCACCNEARNEHGFWQKLDTFVEQETRVKFEYGLCPDCNE